MNKFFITFCLTLVMGIWMPSVVVHAQGYINFSNFFGGTADDNVQNMQVVNGEIYLAISSSSNDFPVTNGSTYKENTDMVIAKYSTDGTLLYATYLGSIGYDKLYVMKVVNGDLYILATADSTGYPVTNGSTFKGRGDIVVTRLNSNGDIVFSTYLGGTGGEVPPDNINNLLITGNQITFVGFTNSVDYPVTAGSYNGGISDVFITQLNANTGATIRSVFVGGSLRDLPNAVYLENGFLYLTGRTASPDLPVTMGNFPGITTEIPFILKTNINNLNIVYFRYLGGNARTTELAAEVLNGEIYMTGLTSASNFPVTNGSTFSGLPNDFLDGFYTKLNSDGNLAFSTYLGTGGADVLSQINIENGDVYLTGTAMNISNPQSRNVIAFKVNANGSLAYTKEFTLGLNFQYIPSVSVLNGELFLCGITKGSDYPVTNGSQYYSDGTGYFTHLDASGNIVYSSFLGKMNSLLPMLFNNNKFYILGSSTITSYPVTDSSIVKGGNDNILIVLNRDGTNIFATYLGGNMIEIPAQFLTINNDLYLSGFTNSPDYPVTSNVLQQGSSDQFLTKLSFCPSGYNISNDSLSPSLQTVCKFGLADIISGKKITLDPGSLPVLFINGVPSTQTPDVEAVYQWQISNSPSGPWINIPNANFKDYRPVIGSTNQYFRRQAFALPGCGSALIHTSDIATVLVNDLTAPVINTGGPFSTCPGIALTIGGAPTVSGGNPPYISYAWDMGAAQVSNPVVSPNSNTIYTLIVTDAAGCKQIGQLAVFTYKAEAGPDRGSCAGSPVKIGTTQIPGVGIVYDWQPGTNLSSTTIAQPFANPTISSDYTLTLTVPISGGGTCSTKDTVSVLPVAAPVTPNFAGPDKVICLKGNTLLGMPPEAGYTYTWSSGSYLTSNTTSTTLYYPGSILVPNPDPATIFLTAQKDGCSFSDQVLVTTIESRAGFTGCGPRIVGLPDRTPNVNETYSWTKISGPGNLTGPINLPQVPVSASIGGTTIYGLTVSYNGGSCFSQVEVPEVCVGCNTSITVNAKYNCPSFNVNLGDVSLIAASNVQDAIFTWTPQVGLSAYTGSIVQLTDNVPRIYTVTATNPIDTSQHCSYQMAVNDPAFSLPVFTAPNATVCASVPTMIGEAPVAGYTYEWTGPGLSNNLISNPFVTIPFETVYAVKITDGNGCEITDEVVVAVQNVQVDAGQDWEVCSNALIQLGTLAQPNTTYLWEPQSSPWQNGTTQLSAQPEVIIAADIVFTVTATTSAGCVSTDHVNVIINNIPLIPDAQNITVCMDSTVLIGAPSMPGVVYQWSPSTGLSNPAIAQPMASPVTTTTYSLVAIFPGSCVSSPTDEVTVTVSDPSFNITDFNYCPTNGAFALGTTAPSNMVSYSWTPTQLVTNPSIANPNTVDPPPNSTTLFTLTVQNADGCIYTDDITITPLTPAPNAGPDQTLCKNQTIVIGSQANISGPGISYSWSPAINLDNPGSSNPVFTGTTAGIFTYILTKTDNSVACSTTDTVVINVIDSLIPVLNPPTVCQNSCVQIGTAPLPGVLYEWVPSAGLSNPNIANPLVCVDAVTVSYTLNATDINGCSSSATIVVGVNDLSAPQLTIPPIAACTGDINSMFNPSVTPPGTYSYLWSPDNGTLSNINIPNPVIQAPPTGTSTYSLQVTDNNSGCSNTAIGNIIVNNCPTTAIVGDYLWFDSNVNGLQDPGELGVSGMLIRLFNSVDFNVASTVTDADGLYTFSNILPGNNYYVVFSLPAGFSYSLQNVGGVAASNNSKADLNGRSNNFNLTAGVSILNIDAGIVPEGCGPVPVTLLSFTAALRNKTVLLKWQTTAEYNNDYFDVERSNTGNNFVALGRVAGNGTTSLPHNYSLTDPHPLIGMNYYRLRQWDFDGQSSYSQIAPIELNADAIITAYYNSMDNTIRVVLNEELQNLRLRLYSNNGQLVKSAALTNNINNYTVELPALTTGIYMLQVTNGAFNYSKKIFIKK